MLHDIAEAGENPREIHRLELQVSPYQIIMHIKKDTAKSQLDPNDEPLWQGIMNVAKLGVNLGYFQSVEFRLINSLFSLSRDSGLSLAISFACGSDWWGSRAG